MFVSLLPANSQFRIIHTVIQVNIVFLLPGEPAVEKKKDEKTDSETPPLYFMNLKLIIPGCNETVNIQVVNLSPSKLVPSRLSL